METSLNCGASWFAKNRDEVLGQGERTEEESGIKGIAGKRVPEERKAGSVTSDQTRSRFWIRTEEPPRGEIRYQEELHGAEKSTRADPRDRTTALQKAANQNAEKEAGVDQQHNAELVKTDEQVARKKRQQGKGEAEAAVFNDCAGE